LTVATKINVRVRRMLASITANRYGRLVSLAHRNSELVDVDVYGADHKG
jgi:hypothetical protein